MNNEQQKCDEEAVLNFTAEPLELDDQYGKSVTPKWGKCFPFYFKNGRPKIVLGPHWPLFLCTYILFVAASIFLIIWHFASDHSNLIRIMTVLVCLNQCFSYAWVALVNPGVANIENYGNDQPKLVQENHLGQDSKAWYCNKCQLVQKIGTIHCHDCDICIVEMDHHCPWTGKCIGRDNLKAFYYFLASTLIFMIFNIVASLTSLESGFRRKREK